MSEALPQLTLQELFASHLRTRLMLRDVLQAEREILTHIIERLRDLPEATREQALLGCIEGAAEGLVYEASG
jgi:hypothetical protein